MRKLLLELIPRCFGTVRNLQLMTINKRRASIGPRIIAFISYSNEDRKYGAQAKSVVAEIRIEAFLAHDDLHVSDEWRKRIIYERVKGRLKQENYFEIQDDFEKRLAALDTDLASSLPAGTMLFRARQGPRDGLSAVLVGKAKRSISPAYSNLRCSATRICQPRWCTSRACSTISRTLLTLSSPQMTTWNGPDRAISSFKRVVREGVSRFYGSANGTRTRISALRGPRANLCTIATLYEYYRLLDFSAI